jgi:hypothetical protein
MAQVAIAMVVWGLTDERGSLGAAIGSGLVFTTLTLLFWRAGMVFEGERTRGQTE